jgi:hypothetical protein
MFSSQAAESIQCRKNARFRGDKSTDNGDNQHRLCRGNLDLKIVTLKIARWENRP